MSIVIGMDRIIDKKIEGAVRELQSVESQLADLRQQETPLLSKKMSLVDSIRSLCKHHAGGKCSHPDRLKKYMSKDFNYDCMTDFCPHRMGGN